MCYITFLELLLNMRVWLYNIQDGYITHPNLPDALLPQSLSNSGSESSGDLRVNLKIMVLWHCLDLTWRLIRLVAPQAGCLPGSASSGYQNSPKVAMVTRPGRPAVATNAAAHGGPNVLMIKVLGPAAVLLWWRALAAVVRAPASAAKLWIPPILYYSGSAGVST